MVDAILQQRGTDSALARDAVCPPSFGNLSRAMNVRFKITAGLFAAIRADLHRPHPFASEQNSLEAAYIVEIVSLECTSIRIDSSNFALETAPKKYIIDCQN